jgi:hypothetical protein
VSLSRPLSEPLSLRVFRSADHASQSLQIVSGWCRRRLVNARSRSRDDKGRGALAGSVHYPPPRMPTSGLPLIPPWPLRAHAGSSRSYGSAQLQGLVDGEVLASTLSGPDSSYRQSNPANNTPTLVPSDPQGGILASFDPARETRSGGCRRSPHALTPRTPEDLVPIATWIHRHITAPSESFVEVRTATRPDSRKFNRSPRRPARRGDSCG